MSVYFVKDKGWRYDFVLKGQRYNGAGYKTKTAAQKAEVLRRQEVEEQRETNPAQPTDMGFLELANRRLDHVQAYNSERHYKELMYMAKRWVAEWGKLKVRDITAEHIQKFVLKRAKVSGHVANKEIRYLRALFNYAKRWKWLKENPADGIPFLPVEKRLKYVPSPDDIDKVIAVADPDTQDYLWVIRETMARVSEVNRLTWEDVNLEARYVVLYTRKKKGGHLTPRKVPMTGRLHEVLSRRAVQRDPGKPWVFWHKYTNTKTGKSEIGPFQYRKKIMGTLCAKAGVRYFRYHALRHSGASLLDSLSVPIGSIQRILGHENRTTTEIYLHSIGDSERKAMDVFESARGQKVPHQVPHHEKGVTDSVT